MTNAGGGDRERTAADAGGRECPFCGSRLFSRHCKYVCPHHGVVIDCSDPFL